MTDRFNAEILAIIDCEIVWDGKDSSTAKQRQTRTTFIGKDCDEDQRKRLYRLLLELDWLPRKLRYAVAEAIGTPVRQRHRDYEAGTTAMLRHSIAEYEAQLRQAGQQPRGGIHAAAVEAIAGRSGMTVEALEKRLERDAQRTRRKNQRRRQV